VPSPLVWQFVTLLLLAACTGPGQDSQDPDSGAQGLSLVHLETWEMAAC